MDNRSRKEKAKRSNSKERSLEKPKQTMLDHLRDVADRIKDQITIIAVERGFEIVIQVAALYGAGEIVRLLVSKDFKVTELIVLLKSFYDRNKDSAIHFIESSSKILLHAGMHLAEIVKEGMVQLKIITTNSF